MATALGKAVSGVRKAYQSGNEQSSGLGKELNERAKMQKIGIGAREGAPAEVLPPASSGLKAAPKVDLVNPNYKKTSIPDSLKPLPKLKKGTPKVTKGGLAVIHKGESVLTKEETAQMRDRGAVALSGSDKPKAKAKAKAPKRMSIESLDDKTFQITHHSDGQEPMQKDQKFSARNAKHLTRHIRQTFGGGAEEPEVPESGQPA